MSGWAAAHAHAQHMRTHSTTGTAQVKEAGLRKRERGIRGKEGSERRGSWRREGDAEGSVRYQLPDDQGRPSQQAPVAQRQSAVILAPSLTGAFKV
jgi:hypothetical protein